MAINMEKISNYRLTKLLFMILIIAIIAVGSGSNVFAETKGEKAKAEKFAAYENADDDWTLWESGHREISFQLNYLDAVATVSLPGNPPQATGYMTNANQFGVSVMIDGQKHTYTFADGSSESSGVFFAIGGNGSASPYMLRPNWPETNRGDGVFLNPNEVRSDYKYYYSDHKVKETSEIKLSTGETLEFTHIVEFRNDGIFHKSYFTNTGNDDIKDFRILNKVDTFLINDSVPVFYGESQHTYYIKQSANATQKLRISGLKGITGSVATTHKRIWDNGFTQAYRNYNTAAMERVGTPGTVAFSGQWPNDDSEIVFDQKPFTLKAGETAETSFAVNFLSGKTVTVRYVDEAGDEIADTEFIQGDLDQRYDAEVKDISGYTLTERPSNVSGTIQQTEQEVVFIYAKNKFAVNYHANGGTGSVDGTDQTFIPGTEVTVEDKGSMVNDDLLFLGWNTRDDGSGTAYAPGDTLIMPEENVDLYAQWERISDMDVKFSKVAVGENSELKGAKLMVIKGDAGSREDLDLDRIDQDDIVAEWTSGSTVKNLKLNYSNAKETTYTLAEVQAPDGYQIAENIIFKTDQSGNLLRKDGNDWIEVKDNKIQMQDARKTGDLSITKKVSGNGAPNEGTEYTFTLKKSSEIVNNFSYTVSGEAKQAAGGTFKLKAGQTATITGLPTGGAYTIAEKTPEDVAKVTRTTTYKVDEAAEKSGLTTSPFTISGDESTAVTFVNKYVKDEIIPPAKTGSLSIQKLVQGDGAPAGGTFTFVVKRGSAAVTNFTYRINGGSSQTSTNGKVVLKAGDKAAITGLSASENYSVTEITPDAELGQYITKNKVDSRADKDGLVTDYFAVIADKISSVVFTNVYEARETETVPPVSGLSGGLSVEKKVIGSAQAADTFTFILKKGNAVVTGFSYSIDGGSDQIAANGRFSLKAGQKATITGLEIADGYTLTEAEPDLKVGYYKTTTSVDGSPEKDGLTTKGFQTVEDDPVTVLFINYYEEGETITVPTQLETKPTTKPTVTKATTRGTTKQTSTGETATTNGGTSSTGPNGGNGPQTGDESNIVLYVLLASLAALAVGGALIPSIRKKS